MSPDVRAGEILLKTDIGDALGLRLPAAALLNLLRHGCSLVRTRGPVFLGETPGRQPVAWAGGSTGFDGELVPVSTLWVKPILS